MVIVQKYANRTAKFLVTNKLYKRAVRNMKQVLNEKRIDSSTNWDNNLYRNICARFFGSKETHTPYTYTSIYSRKNIFTTTLLAHTFPNFASNRILTILVVISS